MRSRPRTRPLILCALIAILLGACLDAGEPVKPDDLDEADLPRPSSSIVDGTDPAGNPHFFWLPPIARKPHRGGELAADLFDHITVEVREWRDLVCGSPLIGEFERDDGLSLVASGEHFMALWHTRGLNLDPNRTYRIRVLLGDLKLGHADVDVVRSGNELQGVDPSSHVGLVQGQTLPIRFRVEQGALPETPLTWESVEPLPVGLRATSAASDGLCIYVLGGNTTLASWTTLNQIFDPSTETWFMGAEFEGARDFAVAAVLPDGIHLVGGFGPTPTGGHPPKADHQLYDPLSDTWSFRAPLPVPTAAPNWAVVEDRLYVFGGRTDAGVTDAMWVYDPATDSWSSAPPMPTARHIAAAAVVNGKIHVAGGQLPNRSPTDAHERFDPESNSWTVLKPLPGILEAEGGGAIFGGGEVDGLFCVFGGRQGDRLTSDPLATTLCYDPESDTWSEGPDMITARMEPAFVDHGGAIYAIGGWTAEIFATRAVERLRR